VLAGLCEVQVQHAADIAAGAGGDARHDQGGTGLHVPRELHHRLHRAADRRVLEKQPVEEVRVVGEAALLKGGDARRVVAESNIRTALECGVQPQVEGDEWEDRNWNIQQRERGYRLAGGVDRTEVEGRLGQV